MPVVDFTQVKGLDPVPEGSYLAKVVHAVDGLSASQQPKTEMRWEIIAPESSAGRQVFDILSFHPDAMFRTKNALIALGFDAEFRGEINAETLMNREAVITLGIEDSGNVDEEGNPYPPRNKIRKFRNASKWGALPAVGGALANLETTEIKPVRARKS